MKESQSLLDMATLKNVFGPTPLIQELAPWITLASQRIGAEQAETDLTFLLSDWLNIPDEMICLGSGSSEVIKLLVKELQISDQVLLPVPGYFGLNKALEKNGVKVIPVRQTLDSDFAYDTAFLKQTLQAIGHHQPQVVWLCSPNNPTGRVWPLSYIEQLAREFSGWLIVDEAYQEYIDPHNHQSAVSLIPDHPGLIVTKTFSKAFALPDIKVGLAVAHPQVIKKIDAHRPKLLPVESSLAAQVALNDLDHLDQFALWLRQEIQIMYEQLATVSCLEVSQHSVTGVMLLRHRSEVLFQALQRLGVVTRDANQDIGIEHERFVRIGLQTSEENLEFVSRLRQLDQ